MNFQDFSSYKIHDNGNSPNSRIQIDQETTMSKVTDIGPIFPSSANYNPAITYNKILLQQIN
ncbi:hypothetical protein IGI04_014363 [Brassica rapa subsp. trilocularis]|uniref:Uncharacterized protein n=1 Tax=Brassica rapa subsp. trilocularis TaxID=1813537 RepID=A0ABQ7MQ84_BRACM|nr:hypothetical protein IGI04_014363 [Brassica rapa subsp. trilocularis]